MKLKAAIIGCGRISFKHVDGFIDNSEKVDLVALCDTVSERTEERAKQFTDKFPEKAVNRYTDFKKMISEEQLDFVTIATESGYHKDISVYCLENGVDVIVEKPMALSTDDADEMIATARKNNRKLAVSFQNRFNVPIQKTHDAVKEGRFGKIFHGQIQVRWNRNDGYYKQAPWRGTWELDGGTLMNQCTHGIDLLQWLMGSDLKRIHGVTRRFQRPIEAEDFGAAILEFENGSVGVVEATANVFPTNLNETLSLFGEKGTVVIGGLAVNKFETWRFADSDEVGDAEHTVIDPDADDPPTVYGFGHTALIGDFIDALVHDRDPFITGEKGKKALEIILGTYMAMKTGQPVDFPINFSSVEMDGIFK